MPAFAPPSWFASTAEHAAQSAREPWSRAQLFLFTGTLSNQSDGSVTFQFEVLAGDGAPTITAGFVKLSVIDRPQRKGFTVPTGYDPIVLEVPVQFEGMVNQPANTSGPWSTIEYDIQKLEWMAGRGKLFQTIAGKGVGAPATGPPPIVHVQSRNAAGQQTALVPPNLHNVSWYISNIQYDTHSLRDTGGNRVRQAATVTLTEVVAYPVSSGGSPSARAKARSNATAQTIKVHTTASANTIAKVTELYAHNSTLAGKQAVLAANKDKLKIKSWNQVLPLGTLIVIPASVMQGAAGRQG